MSLPRVESPLATARRAAAAACAGYCSAMVENLRDGDYAKGITISERAHLTRAFRDLGREMTGRSRGSR